MRIDGILVVFWVIYGDMRDDSAANCLTTTHFRFISFRFIFILFFILLIVVIEKSGVSSVLTQADSAKEWEGENEE